MDYAHPHNKQDAKTAIHWARLAAKIGPHITTIMTIPNNNWYQNFKPQIGPFLDNHIIAYIPTNTLIFEEPNIPPELNKLGIEPSAIHIMCKHHLNTNVGTIERKTLLQPLLINNLQIPRTYIHIALQHHQTHKSIKIKHGIKSPIQSQI